MRSLAWHRPGCRCRRCRVAGRPCTARAYAPTTRKRTSASTNARNRSTKSGFIRPSARELPLLLAQLPDQQDAVRGGDLLPELHVAPVGVGRRREASHRHVPLARDCTLGKHARIIAQYSALDSKRASASATRSAGTHVKWTAGAALKSYGRGDVRLKAPAGLASWRSR